MNFSGCWLLPRLACHCFPIDGLAASFGAAVVADMRCNPAGCDGEIGGDSSDGVAGRGFASVLAD
jgi:hypothetical protein